MIELGQMTETTMKKYGDTYEIRRRFDELDLFINDKHFGSVDVDNPNIYEWVIEHIQDWLDNKESYLKDWNEIKVDDYF